jgi:hypothetical protein
MEINQLKIKNLGFYEEAVGTLVGMTIDHGFLIAQISKVRIVLPIEMENKLLPLIGTRVGILRTDIQGKEYLFRIIEGKKSNLKTPLNDFGNARTPEICEASA